jgi:hypothetical protein
LSDHQYNNLLIRAAHTKNWDLLGKLLDNSKPTSTLKRPLIDSSYSWGPDCDRSVLTELFRHGEYKQIKKFMEASPQTSSATPFGIKEINTGYNSKYAYGVRTRKVCMGRGNRQGNIALIGDVSSSQSFGPRYWMGTREGDMIVNNITVEMYKQFQAEDIG